MRAGDKLTDLTTRQIAFEALDQVPTTVIISLYVFVDNDNAFQWMLYSVIKVSVVKVGAPCHNMTVI
jgi:hypothetical protein